MNFQKDYAELIKISSKLLKEFGIKSLHNEEVVSETYILLNDIPYNKIVFIQKMKTLVRESMREKFYTNKKIIYPEKMCLGCKEILDKSQFGVVRVTRYNGAYMNAYCRECSRKKAIYYYNKHKSTKEGQRYLKEKNKRRKRNMVNNLPDHYIRELLKTKYSLEFLRQPENYYLIQEKRKQILKTRLLNGKKL